MKGLMKVKKKSTIKYQKIGNTYHKFYTTKAVIYVFKYIPFCTYKTEVIDLTNNKK